MADVAAATSIPISIYVIICDATISLWPDSIYATNAVNVLIVSSYTESRFCNCYAKVPKNVFRIILGALESWRSRKSGNKIIYRKNINFCN